MTKRCPRCKEEFADGLDICMSCKGSLKKRKRQKQMEYKTEGAEVVRLISVSDHVEAGIIQGILENENIPSYSIDKESGGYMRVYMGYSIFGEDIYVRASDLSAASACLKDLSCPKEIGGGPDEEWEQPEALAAEAEKEAKELSGSRPLLFQDRRIAALLVSLFLIIAAITMLFK